MSRKPGADVPKRRVISLFCGCGGSDLAVQKLGFDIVWANDILDVACQTYRDNIPNAAVVKGDISSFTEFPDAELLVGCYPCQGYSQGGIRDPSAEINFLYREFDRVLRAVRPRAFVVENVNGMVYGDNRKLLLNQVYRYRLAGYRVRWTALDAKNYGVPQTRRRVFIVGIRSDIAVTYQFPEPTHGPERHRAFVGQRDVIAGMPAWPEGEFCDEKFHWYYLSRNRRHTWARPSPCIVGHWRHVPLHPMSPPLKRLGADKWRFTRDGRARRLTYSECARLQGFPANFKLNHGTIRERFQLVGNAVPPPLFEAVVRNLPEIWS